MQFQSFLWSDTSYRELELREYRRCNDVADLLVESLRLWKQCWVVAKAFLHQSSNLLAEITYAVWVPRCVICKRAGPSSRDSENTLRWDQKHLFISSCPLPLANELGKIDQSPTKVQFALIRPDRAHSFPQENRKECADLLFPIETIALHFMTNHTVIKHQLQKLQADALPRCLRPDQNGEVAEPEIRFLDRSDIAEGEFDQFHD